MHYGIMLLAALAAVPALGQGRNPAEKTDRRYCVDSCEKCPGLCRADQTCSGGFRCEPATAVARQSERLIRCARGIEQGATAAGWGFPEGASEVQFPEAKAVRSEAASKPAPERAACWKCVSPHECGGGFHCLNGCCEPQASFCFTDVDCLPLGRCVNNVCVPLAAQARRARSCIESVVDNFGTIDGGCQMRENKLYGCYEKIKVDCDGDITYYDRFTGRCGNSYSDCW